MELIIFYVFVALSFLVYFIKESPKDIGYLLLALGCSLLWPLTLLFFFTDKD
jgi:hypothetical protein